MEDLERKRSIGFLDLPLEIRLPVYHYSLVRRSTIVVDWLHNDPDQFESLSSENLSIEHSSTRDSNSIIINKEIPKTSAFEADWKFQDGDVGVKFRADLDLKADRNDEDDSEFSWNAGSGNSVEPKSNCLVLVCKQVSREATDILYGGNTFRCLMHRGGEYGFKEHFSEANIRKIRKLEVVLGPKDDYYAPRKMLDRELWSAILKGLAHLSIIAQQPPNPRCSFEAQSPLSPGIRFYGGFQEKEIAKWNDWAGLILEFMASQLADSCQICIDDDEKFETGVLVKQRFPKAYQQVRTVYGDICFNRGIMLHAI